MKEIRTNKLLTQQELENLKFPERLDRVWTEPALSNFLGLPVSKSGRSAVLGNWIKDGLQYAEKSNRRYFFEQDVLEYLWSKRGLDPNLNEG